MKIEKVSSWKIKGDLEVGGVIQSQNRSYMLLSHYSLWFHFHHSSHIRLLLDINRHL